MQENKETPEKVYVENVILKKRITALLKNVGDTQALQRENDNLRLNLENISREHAHCSSDLTYYKNIAQENESETEDRITTKIVRQIIKERDQHWIDSLLNRDSIRPTIYKSDLHKIIKEITES